MKADRELPSSSASTSFRGNSTRGSRSAGIAAYDLFDRDGDRDEVPPLRALEPEHLVSCHWAEQIKTGEIQPKEVEAVFVEAASATRTWEPPPD